MRARADDVQCRLRSARRRLDSGELLGGAHAEAAARVVRTGVIAGINEEETGDVDGERVSAVVCVVDEGVLVDAAVLRRSHTKFQLNPGSTGPQ